MYIVIFTQHITFTEPCEFDLQIEQTATAYVLQSSRMSQNSVATCFWFQKFYFVSI